ncbi:MAG: G8 domain-containing protein [Bryobacteraceae bacterium]
MFNRRTFLSTLAAGSLTVKARAGVDLIRSARSGPWSAASTWENNRVPGQGATVQILSGHAVLYDQISAYPVRMVHVLGNLKFAGDRDTMLDVGLLKIGGDSSEDGFNCTMNHSGPRPVLEVGSPENPISASRTARIRLVYFDGADKESLPSIVCCGGRMDFHGAPLSRTWLKLGAPASKGDTEITLAEPVTGWRVGDRIILTATTRQNKAAKTYRNSVRDNTQTEERVIQAVQGAKIVVDQPLVFNHTCDGLYRGDVANLSRNVIVESADPSVARGHTMYHHGSAGSVSYAEFRRLGKEGVLGRYSMHFHRLGDSMRGSSVIGASIWDSGNRWITVHGTDFLVVRDCVGYNSMGHGFFLEDGTEQYNVFDRNIAVQARIAKRLPDQVLPYDYNDGAGFWWANSRNTFTRNVAAECDEYGFRFDVVKSAKFDPVLTIREPDGKESARDIRTLPFVRFEDNESHCQRRHSFNLGGLDTFLEGGCGEVGPDEKHPFILRNSRSWNSHWAFHTKAPCVMVENFDIHNVEYGIWKQNFDRHAYRGLNITEAKISVIFDSKGTQPVEAIFPKPLSPVDDVAPITVITRVSRAPNGKIVVRGTTQDVAAIKRVQLNGVDVKAVQPNFAEWEATVPAGAKLTVRAEDYAGNVTTTERKVDA